MYKPCRIEEIQLTLQKGKKPTNIIHEHEGQFQHKLNQGNKNHRWDYILWKFLIKSFKKIHIDCL